MVARESAPPSQIPQQRATRGRPRMQKWRRFRKQRVRSNTSGALDSILTLLRSRTAYDPQFNSQMIQSPSKRVRDQYKSMSSRTANEPRMIRELFDHIESVIAQLRGEKSSPSRRRSCRAQSMSPTLRKHLWVVKWVDYSQKYGLGCAEAK